MILSLVLLPLVNVPRLFSLLENDKPEDLLPIFTYFERLMFLKCQLKEEDGISGYSLMLFTSNLKSIPSNSSN